MCLTCEVVQDQNVEILDLLSQVLITLRRKAGQVVAVSIVR